MPELIALWAAFGQDEANHGIGRYCVDSDGLVRVPPEAVRYLTHNGGFALVRPRPGQDPGGSIRLHHGDAASCSYGGKQYRSDANGDVVVPAAAAAALIAHGYVPVDRAAAAGRGRRGARDVEPEKE